MRDPRAYLVRIVTRQALNRLRTLARRREEYVGEWLPEPLLTSPDVAEDVEFAESVSIAMLTVLETLAPAERAVFVLREVFDLPYDDIAAAVDKTPAAVRQIAHRARDHVAARRPRMQVDRAEQQQVVERFLAALRTGDLQVLIDVLAPDVVLVADGGGEVAAARHPVVGRERVAALLSRFRTVAPEAVVGTVWLNGAPAGRIDLAGELNTAVSVVVADGRITRIYAIRNPHKLARLDERGRAQPLTAAAEGAAFDADSCSMAARSSRRRSRRPEGAWEERRRGGPRVGSPSRGSQTPGVSSGGATSSAPSRSRRKPPRRPRTRDRCGERRAHRGRHHRHRRSAMIGAPTKGAAAGGATKGREPVADKRLVISIFGAEADADAAADALRDTGVVVDDAIGILVLDESGELKTHKVGPTSGGKGAAVGAVFGLLGPIGLGVGIAGGALLGHLHHKSLGLEDADRDRLGVALRGGKAAVGVLGDPGELVAIESILVDRGGETTAHEFDEAVLAEVTDSAGR